MICDLQRMEMAEMKKIADDRKREKAEDRLARQRVKEQIARDREERERKAQHVKSSVPTTPPQPAVAEVKKNYTTCRLQVFWSTYY